MQSSKNIAILGAGPIGSVLAIILARKGYNIEIYEKRQNPTQGIDHSKRQINYGVSLRGVQAFKQIQVWDKIEKHSIPMKSRTYHNRNGTIRYHQYGKRNEAIYSIRSELLTNLLLKQLGGYENIKINYNTDIHDINLEKSTIEFVNDDGTQNQKEYSQIFMTDDSFKIIKRNLIFQKGFKFTQDYSSFGYIETQIPANMQNEFAYNPNSFHLWTNDDFHIIAMPNKNKTFTCNLFMPLTGEVSFDTIKSNEDYKRFLDRYFPELSEIMIISERSITPNNIGRLYDHKCFPWVFNNLCLFGNAAHNIFPYFGQALNAGLEDCSIIADLIEKHRDDWKTVTTQFQNLRKPNTDAISDLAKMNFENIKNEMYDDEFQEKKLIINYLSDNYEDMFMSQNQLIEFSNIDFQKAKTFSKVEAEIIKQVRMIPNFDKIIENNKKDSIIRQILKSFIGKYDVENTAVEIINQLGVLSKNQEVILLPNIGQFEIAQTINCTIQGDKSFTEQIEEMKQFKGDYTRARTTKDQGLRGHQYLNETQLGLCMEISLDESKVIDLKTINEAYDKAILKSIQQSMKNINSIYKVALLKVSGISNTVIRMTPDVTKYIEEKGFQIISVNGQFLDGSDEDNYLEHYLSKPDQILIELLHLEQLEYGAYIINIESNLLNNNVAPITLKARRILNAELLDIYAHKRREVYYSEYLAVEELISLMRNRTDYIEEKLFIRVHQINELAMQQSIITLEHLIKIFQSKQVIENLQYIEEYMNQILRFFMVQKETNFVLCEMNTKNFVHGFRSYLGTASGVQSCQFYILQMLLGLSRDRHILYDPVKLLHLKEYDIQKIKGYQNHESLFKVIQDWLLDYYNESEDVRKIGQSKHIDDVLKGCKDFSREVGITVLYLLNNPDCIQSKIVEYVLKFESSFLTFLDSHIVLVDHHLGNKRGTGQSSGGQYLRQSKMSQIIWRDLYHLQNHAKSFNQWNNQTKLQEKLLAYNDPYQDIMQELSIQDQNDQLIDLTRSDSLIKAKINIKNIIKDQLTQNFDDHSDNFSSGNYKKDSIQFAQFDISKRYDAILDHKNIILSNSHKKSIANVLTNFITKGDNIVVLTPCSSTLHFQSKKKQIDIRYLNILEGASLALQEERLKQLIDKNTKAIFIPNFSELIGQDLSQEQYSIIQDTCDYNKLFVIYDEGLSLSAQQTTKNILKQSTKTPSLIVSSIPISDNMREFEVSWILPINHEGYFDNILSHKTSHKSSNTVSLTTLNCLPTILDNLRDVESERLLNINTSYITQIVEKINSIEGLSTLSTIDKQNLLISLDLEKFKDIEDDIQFAKALLQKHHIKLIPSQAYLQPNKLIIVLDQQGLIDEEFLSKIEAFCLEYRKAYKGKIGILGIGPVGAVMAILMAKEGFEVEVFEKRPDPTLGGAAAGRSVNLSLSMRAIKTFGMIGAKERILKHGIELFGRTSHNKDGCHFHQYGREGQCNFSISRHLLNNLLIEAAKEEPGVTITFNQNLLSFDLNETSMTFAGQDGQTYTKHFEQVFAADGAFSAIRKQFITTQDFNYSQEYSDFGYLEFEVPANPEGGFYFHTNSFHLWPRFRSVLLAMPNTNGTFTCNLFLPIRGPDSFESLSNEEDFVEYMNKQFPDAAPLMNTMRETIRTGPRGRLCDIKCYPWVFNNFCLIGDAAHAIFPFYGQGLNAGLEDCSTLIELYREFKGDWQTITQKFQTSRKINTDAISDLSKQNFVELRDKMADQEFLLKKYIIGYLSDVYNDLYLSQYSMISFSHTPYHIANAFGKVEDEIIKEIKSIPNFKSLVDSKQRHVDIENILLKYKGIYHVDDIKQTTQLSQESAFQNEKIYLPNIGEFTVDKVIDCTRPLHFEGENQNQAFTCFDCGTAKKESPFPFDQISVEKLIITPHLHMTHAETECHIKQQDVFGPNTCSSS